MLRFLHDYCLSSGQMLRREWLRLASASGLSLLAAPRELGAAERSEAKFEPGFGKAKSVRLEFGNGGQSQIDLWDPNPNAPLDVRGDFRPTATAVPGIHFCEHRPRIAAVADKLSVIRSMSHE